MAVAALLAMGTYGVARAEAPASAGQPATRPGSRPAAQRLTLDDAVALALQNSRSLRAAAEGVARARGMVGESRAVRLPNLSSSVTAMHLDQGSAVSLPVGPGGTSIMVPLVKQDQKQVDVVAALPIDITGQIAAAVNIAQFQEIGARLAYNAARNKLVSDVRGAYLDVLRAREFVTVADQVVQRSQDQLTTSEAYLRAGTGTKFDVLRSQTAVADAAQARISAGNRVSLATAALANVLGLDQNTPVETLRTEAAAPAGANYDDAVTEAYRCRPEVLHADAVIRAAEKGLVLANRSQMPSMSLAWNFSYTPDQGGFSPKTTSWAAVAKVTLPLFEGGAAAARRQQARADVASARLARQMAMDGIALEVRQAFLSVDEARERVKVATAGLTQAEEQYRLAQVRFKAGVTSTPGGSPQLEIADARTALAQSQTNRINAAYDLEGAQARYEAALGRFAYDGKPGPGLKAPGVGGVR